MTRQQDSMLIDLIGVLGIGASFFVILFFAVQLILA